LVALLLDAQKPLSWAAIREAFPDDYGAGSVEAAERKFERDKSELLELGLPIKWVSNDEDRDDGYVVDKEGYYLPEVSWSPEELAVLYAAGSAALASGAFPGRQELAHALRKIGFFSDGPLPLPKVRLELGNVADAAALPERLELLWTAISARKSVDMEYFSPRSQKVTQRRVDPFGLALRRGMWTLVGFCHLRQGVRSFHVHRIRTLIPNPLKPKSADFEVPKNFQLSEFVPTWPWQHRFHEPVEVTITLQGPLAPLAASLFPTAAPKDTTATFTVTATDLEGLLKYVLSLGPDAKVIGPADAIGRWKSMAKRVLDAHQGAA
jgi:proteasome accessory factor B